jgi:2-hydroxychromene-2-carboxylate isomerase
VVDPRLSPSVEQPRFLYDLGNPACYLVAEQITSALSFVPEWVPVRGEGIDVDRPAIEREAQRLGLQPLRWPRRWPPDSELALLAATYASGVGRVVAFSLAAFRQAFAGGRDLAEPDTVLIAAAACELHPAAVLKGVRLRSVRDRLERSSRQAAEAGASVLPALLCGDRLFSGENMLGEALHALGKVA